MKRFASLVLLCLVFQVNEAQEEGENQLGAWYMYSGTHRINKKMSISSVVQLWDYEPTDNFNLFLVLGGIDYGLTPNLTTTIGYGYATIDRSFEYIPDEDMTREHRMFEQLRYKSSIQNLQIGHRYRIEHRFLEDGLETNLKHRNRYRLQLTLPLSETFFVNVYDEIFWHFEKDPFNQNRLYAALGICMTPNSKFQLGYMKHHLTHKSYDRLQVSIAINTDFRKQKNTTVANFDKSLNSEQHELVSD